MYLTLLNLLYLYVYFVIPRLYYDCKSPDCIEDVCGGQASILLTLIVIA